MADFLRCVCPETKAEIQTDIAIDAPTLARLWGKQIRIACRFCQMRHAFSVKEAYLQQALSCVPARSGMLIGAIRGAGAARPPSTVTPVRYGARPAPTTSARGARRAKPQRPAGQAPIVCPTANDAPVNGGWPHKELHFTFRTLAT